MMNFANIPRGAKVFVDANTFVYHFASEPTYGAAATALLQRLESKEIQGYFTSHVLAEASHRLMTIEACSLFGWPYAGIAARLQKHQRDIAALTRFQQAVFEIDLLNLESIDVQIADVLRAAEISRQFGLLTNDAVVVAVMQRRGLQNIASNDEDFDRVSGITRFAPI